MFFEWGQRVNMGFKLSYIGLRAYKKHIAYKFDATMEIWPHHDACVYQSNLPLVCCHNLECLFRSYSHHHTNKLHASQGKWFYDLLFFFMHLLLFGMSYEKHIVSNNKHSHSVTSAHKAAT